MTASTTILNLMPLVLPMVYGTSEGFARRWGPVGLVVVSGLACSTVLTLILAPTLYSLLDDVALWWRRVIRAVDDNSTGTNTLTARVSMTRRIWIGLLTAAVGAEAEPLTLEECIEQALIHNNQVRLAKQTVRRSEASVKSARAERLPNANVTLMNFTRARTGPSVRVQENPTELTDPATGRRIFREETTLIPAIERSSFSFSASVNQNLYDGGRSRHGHNSARQSLSGAEMDMEAQRATTVFNAKERFFALLKAQDLVEVQREALKLSEKQLEEAEARLEVGAGIRADVLRLQVATENAQADLINAEQQEMLARANLNHIMGAKISEPLEIAPVTDFEPVDPTEIELADLVRQALDSNPLMERLRFTQESASHDLSAAKAAWHPRVDGGISYSRNNEVFDRVYQELDQNYRLSANVSLTYNLFDGGVRGANVARSRSSLETARMNTEQQQRDLALSVETAYLELVRLNKILRINERTVELAKEDLRLAEESYRVGRGTLLELLDAQVGFIQARSNQVRGRHDLAVADAEVERLTAQTPLRGGSDFRGGP